MNVAVVFASVTLTSFTDNEGPASSSEMVKVAVASEIDALEGLLIVIVTVSLPSKVVSANTATSIVLDVSPAANVSVPLVAV